MSSDSEMIQFDIKTEENNEIPVFNKPNINHFSCSEILKVSCSYSDVVEGFKNLSVSVPIITKKMKDSEALKIILSEIEILEETIFKLENSKKLKLIKIECLREIIERIAKENSFEYIVIETNPTKNLISEDRKNKKRNEILYSTMNNSSQPNMSEYTTNSTEGLEEMADVKDCISSGDSHFQDFDKHHQQCYAFWREHLPIVSKF